MSKVTSESAFEDSIEAHVLASGWLNGDPSGYDRGIGPDMPEPVGEWTLQPDLASRTKFQLERRFRWNLLLAQQLK